MLHISRRETGQRFSRRALSARAVGFTTAVMSLSFALTCGAFAANGKSANRKADAHGAVAAIAPAEIAGRWSGNYYGHGSHHAGCAGSGCTITLDISACATGWCGVRVKDDGGCGGVGMTVITAEARPNAQKFTGKLDLVPGAEAYTIEATLWKSSDEPPKRFINMIGDTGPELRFMRRSFPFEAALSRLGDATCVIDKPVS